MKTTRTNTPATLTAPGPEPAPILRPLALSERLNQMLVKSLQRALHESDPVESILILSFIQRAADLRNDMIQFHNAIRERLDRKS